MRQRRTIAGLAVTAALLAGGGAAGAAAGGAFTSGPAPGSADGGQCTACSVPAGQIPADPTMDAQCTIEPDGIAPSCTQGNYRVALTLGAPCVDPQYVQPDSWQETSGGTVRCVP